MTNMTSIALSLLACLAFTLCGCGDATAPVGDNDTTTELDEHAGHDHGPGEHEGVAGHDHSGWWCPEHGVPEEECALCDTTLVASYKADGDWCEEHNRPDSHCFLCDPSKFETFAARYEAKYGEEPPKWTE